MVAGGIGGSDFKIREACMAMSPTEVELLARVSVIEYLVAQLFNMKYLRDGLSMEQVKEEHRKVKNLMKRQTNPGFDAAQSALLAGEMEDALADDLEMIEQLFERYSRIGRQPDPSN
jgi:hypothetical protein